MAPGSSPGTLTINGDYTQGAGGTLRAEIASAGHDRLDVTGDRDARRDAPARHRRRASTRRPRPPSESSTRRRSRARSRPSPAGRPRRRSPTSSDYDPTGVTLTIGPRAGQHGAAVDPGERRARRHDHAASRGRGRGLPTFAYAWLRDGAPVATGPAYTLSAADVGRSIVCRVTATNANGSAGADSNTLSAASRRQPEPPPTADPHARRRRRRRRRLRGRASATADDWQDGQRGGRARHGDRSGSPTAGRSRSTTRRRSHRLGDRHAPGRGAAGIARRRRQARQRRLLRRAVQASRRPAAASRSRSSSSSSSSPARRPSARTPRPRSKKKRRLWGDATGNFRTRGRYGSAVNTGHEVDGRGPLRRHAVPRRRAGRSSSRKNGSRETVRVRAGRQYLVRA